MTTLLIFYNDVVDIFKKRTGIWHEEMTRHGGECVASIGSSLNLANHAIVLDTLQRISTIRNDRHL